MINNIYGFFEAQHWLVAHNAWNTEIAPNQCKTVTELLNHGVRGLALDIWGDDEASLHLQHGPGNLASWTDWSVVLAELVAWMGDPKNKGEIVTLFFESYLEGPKGPGDDKSPLHALDHSLQSVPGYKSGRSVMEKALSHQTVAYLAQEASHRLFAFIEKEPATGGQSLFPVMKKVFAENMYGDDSVHQDTWTKLRPGSSVTNPLTFMNHFGDAPTGSQWERNHPDLIMKHAFDFAAAYGQRFPNFVSLDYIDWAPDQRDPMEAVALMIDGPQP